MLRKSVETRDWLNTIEPRNVRAVMKRVVEDITSIDSQVRICYAMKQSSLYDFQNQIKSKSKLQKN